MNKCMIVPLQDWLVHKNQQCHKKDYLLKNNMDYVSMTSYIFFMAYIYTGPSLSLLSHELKLSHAHCICSEGGCIIQGALSIIGCGI